MSYIQTVFQSFFTGLVNEFKIGDLGESIQEAIVPHELFAFNLFGTHWNITDAVVASWGVMVVIAILGYILGYKPQRVPTTKRQLIAESLIDLLLKVSQSAGMTYDQSERIIPYVGTIALFISLTNLLGVFKIPPPAKNPAFPIALALFTIVYVIVMSIRFVGVKGFWLSLIYPKAALLPFKILDYLIKPVSLSLRLFGNIFGAFIVMEFIYLIIPIVLPGVVGLWFDLADGILQGVIFTYLSITYIGEVVEGAHMAVEDSAHAHGHA